MLFLKNLNEDLLVASQNKLILHKRKEQSNTIIDVKAVLKEIVIENSDKKTIHINCLAVSNNLEYFAFCTNQKQVIVLSNGLNIIKSFTTNRVASQIIFTPSNVGIVIADRTGDVYYYELDKDVEKPVLLLGHLSVVIDVQISECGNYIITCDRDEKIRVSCFPNAYNIVSYCLGHEEFVSSIKIFSNYLVSSSGDGTIRFWNYKDGKELQKINTNEKLEKSFVDNFISDLNSKDIETKSVPVTEIRMVVKESVIIVAAALYQYPNILVYKVQSNSFDILSVNIVNVSNTFTFTLAQDLMVLNENNLTCYSLKDEHCEVSVNNISEEVIEDIISNLKFKVNDNVLSLYKKKFDNVQDYLEKKKIRLDQK